MNEAFVQLRCPNCLKDWEENPTDLPDTKTTFTCPDCGEQERLAEFARTDRDLETLRDLQLE